MLATITDRQTEMIGPDYQLAFSHLAYIVGQLKRVSDDAEREVLMAKATRIVDAVYSPVHVLNYKGDEVQGMIATLQATQSSPN